MCFNRSGQFGPGTYEQDLKPNLPTEQCRAGKLVLPSFPDFGPHIAALKSDTGFDQNKTYRVTCQVHDKLLILDSLARKWFDDEATCEEAKRMVKAHNDEYNPEGDLLSKKGGYAVAAGQSRLQREIVSCPV